MVTLEHVSRDRPDRQRPADAQHPPLPGRRRRRAPTCSSSCAPAAATATRREIWEGSAELRLYDDTLEDLQAIAPREMLRGYRFSFGYTVDGVEVVAQHDRRRYT